MNQVSKAFTDALTGVSYCRYIDDNAQRFIASGANYQYWCCEAKVNGCSKVLTE